MKRLRRARARPGSGRRGGRSRVASAPLAGATSVRSRARLRSSRSSRSSDRPECRRRWWRGTRAARSRSSPWAFATTAPTVWWKRTIGADRSEPRPTSLRLRPRIAGPCLAARTADRPRQPRAGGRTPAGRCSSAARARPLGRDRGRGAPGAGCPAAGSGGSSEQQGVGDCVREQDEPHGLKVTVDRPGKGGRARLDVVAQELAFGGEHDDRVARVRDRGELRARLSRRPHLRRPGARDRRRRRAVSASSGVVVVRMASRTRSSGLGSVLVGAGSATSAAVGSSPRRASNQAISRSLVAHSLHRLLTADPSPVRRVVDSPCTVKS